MDLISLRGRSASMCLCTDNRLFKVHHLSAKHAGGWYLHDAKGFWLVSMSDTREAVGDRVLMTSQWPLEGVNLLIFGPLTKFDPGGWQIVSLYIPCESFPVPLPLGGVPQGSSASVKRILYSFSTCQPRIIMKYWKNLNLICRWPVSFGLVQVSVR